MGGEEVDEVDLISFKKQDSTWRALLPSDIENMLNSLAEEISPPSKEDERGAPAGAGRQPRKP
jgi:hypothetical protein